MTDWRDKALCATHPDPDLWYDQSRTAEARAICAACPVQRACFVDAMRVEAGAHSSRRFGMRAGTLPLNRAEMSA